MKIIFFGTPEFAVPTLLKLLNHPDFEVIGIITQPDKRRGRGNQLIPSPVKACALSHNLPIWQPERIKKDTQTLSYLQQAQADIFVVIAYGQILSQKILNIPRLGCINVHGSILPQYRGAAPIQWCLYNGEKQTGITTMLMDAGMDTGAMLLKAYTPIELLDNAEKLAEKLSQIGADLLIETLQKITEIKPNPQDSHQATYAPLITKTDYYLNWNKTAIELHNQIRGFYPNCIAKFRNQTLKISATVPIGPEYWPQLPQKINSISQDWPSLTAISAHPGEIIKIIKGIGPIVQTGTGLLLLQEVQQAGKRTQNGWDFANGTRLQIGEILQNGD